VPETYIADFSNRQKIRNSDDNSKKNSEKINSNFEYNSDRNNKVNTFPSEVCDINDSKITEVLVDTYNDFTEEFSNLPK